MVWLSQSRARAKPGSRCYRIGISSIIGGVIVILLALAILSTIVFAIEQIYTASKISLESMKMYVKKLAVSECLHGLWLYSDGVLKINITNFCNDPVYLVGIGLALPNGSVLTVDRMSMLNYTLCIQHGSSIVCGYRFPLYLGPMYSAIISIPLETSPRIVGLAVGVGSTVRQVSISSVRVEWVGHIPWIVNGSYMYSNPATRYVGIGTSEPLATLHVNGTVVFQNLPQAVNPINWVLVIADNGSVYKQSIDILAQYIASQISSYGVGGTDLDWLWNGSKLYANPMATAVGIGTTNPEAPLEVVATDIIGYKIIIYNPNDYDLSEFQVNVSIKLLPFRTFVVYDENGNTVPYCFEQPNGECNTTPSSVIWIRVPHIPAHGQTVLYVYKSQQIGASNGDKVFDFYDDFHTLNTSKWIVLKNVSVVNGVLVVSGSNSTEVMHTAKTFSGVIVVEWRMRPNATTASDWDAGIALGNTSNYIIMVDDYGSDVSVERIHGLSISYPQWWQNTVFDDGRSSSDLSYHTYRAIVNFTARTAILIDLTDGRQISTMFKADIFDGYLWLVNDADSNLSTIYDWIRVRKYANEMPRVTIEPILQPNPSKLALEVIGRAQITNLTITGIARNDSATRVLVIDEEGNVYWRDVSTIRDNDWFWNGDYLYTTASRVGIGTSTPVAELDVVGTIRGRNVTTDYLTISENGTSTGWYLDYAPENERLSIVKKGYGEVLSLLPNGYVGIGTTSPQYRLEVVGDVRISGRLGTVGYAPDNGYPPGWYGGVHTWDVYAEASIGVGAGGGLGVWITHENNNGKIILYANGREMVKLIASEGAIYADYYRFTENGNPTEFELEYFPNTPVGNTIGISYFDGYQWRGVFFVNGNGYVFAPRYYITEEGDEANPRWHLDYVPDNNRLTINYDYGGSPKEVAYVLPSGSMWILRNLGTHGFDPDHGYPRGWDGGIHTWDVYAEGSIGVGRSGSLTVVITDDSDAQGYIRLNNLWSNQWGQISRWTNRLEIAASDAIGFAIGEIGNTIMMITQGKIDVYSDVWFNGRRIFDVDDIFISGSNDHVGAIYGPDNKPKIILDGSNLRINVDGGTLTIDVTNGYGIYIRGLSENVFANRVLVLDENGRLYYRYLIGFGFGEWRRHGKYLRLESDAHGIDMNNKDIINVDEIRGSSPTIYASNETIYLRGAETTYVHIWNPPKKQTYSYEVAFYCMADDCYIVRVSSSMRYKTDIRPLIEYINTSKIYELQPVIFRDKLTNETSIGLIAEQVAKVFPILVTFDEKGLPDAVKYNLLPVLMLPELKKHEVSIRWLNTTVKQLVKEVRDIKKLVSINMRTSSSSSMTDIDNGSNASISCLNTVSGVLSMEKILWRAFSFTSLAIAIISLLIACRHSK